MELFWLIGEVVRMGVRRVTVVVGMNLVVWCREKEVDAAWVMAVSGGGGENGSWVSKIDRWV